jgi:hypothetical protein
MCSDDPYLLLTQQQQQQTNRLQAYSILNICEVGETNPNTAVGNQIIL